MFIGSLYISRNFVFDICEKICEFLLYELIFLVSRLILVVELLILMIKEFWKFIYLVWVLFFWL